MRTAYADLKQTFSWKEFLVITSNTQPTGERIHVLLIPLPVSLEKLAGGIQFVIIPNCLERTCSVSINFAGYL